jgi:Mn-containing catalase
MSTLMNYTYQSFNFRGRNRLRPFCDLISCIAAKEYGHIEVVSCAINLLLTGTTQWGTDPVPPRCSAAFTPAMHTTLLPAGSRPCRLIQWVTSGRARTCSAVAT